MEGPRTALCALAYAIGLIALLVGCTVQVEHPLVCAEPGTAPHHQWPTPELAIDVWAGPELDAACADQMLATRWVRLDDNPELMDVMCASGVASTTLETTRWAIDRLGRAGRSDHTLLTTSAGVLGQPLLLKEQPCGLVDEMALGLEPERGLDFAAAAALALGFWERALHRLDRLKMQRALTLPAWRLLLRNRVRKIRLPLCTPKGPGDFQGHGTIPELGLGWVACFGDRTIHEGSAGTTRASREGRMSYRESSMIEVKEVLRRREAEQGCGRSSARQIRRNRRRPCL